MKYKLFSVLIILAMVASLCAVAVVAPIASANVGAATVTLDSAAASQTSGYEVEVTLGAAGALTALSDDISITFPAGTVLPSSMNYLNVLVSTTGTAAMNVGSGGVSVSGQTVTVRMPMGAPNSGTVTVSFAQSLGIVNPALSMEPVSGGDGQGTSGYTVQVKTGQETTLVASIPYFIYNWVAVSPMALAQGGAATITGGGFMPGQSVVISGGASTAGIIGTVGADGTFSMTGFGAGNTQAVTATDGSARTASTAAVTLLPSLSVSPASGNIGSVVVLSGKNFAGIPNSGTKHVSVGGTPINSSTLVLSDVDKDLVVDDFIFSTTIPIGLPGGAKVVRVIDPGAAGSPTATATFTIAEQRVTAAPASGAAGSSVVLSGAGWPPSATSGGILLWSYGGGRVAAIGDYSVETDGTGAFTEVAIIPTDAPAGMSAVVCSFGASTALAFYTVTPNALSLSPTSGPKGTRVSISGGGLSKSIVGTTYTAGLSIGGGAWTGGSAVILDTQGNLTPTTLAVGSSVAEGINTVAALDNHPTTPLTAAGTFEVTKPTLELDVTEAYRGQIVTAIGSGWLPGITSLVTITMGGTAMTVVKPAADGTVWAQFQVPATATFAPGELVAYNANDGSIGNSSLSGTLSIPNAKLTVDPESGPVGTSITITGEGFRPLTGVSSLTLGGVTLLPTGSVLTNSVGDFTATATVPGLGVGGQAVSAQADDVASTSFSITAAATGSTTPTTGFATISDCIDIAWSFDGATQAWLVYDPNEGAASTLETLAANQGLWVQVAEDCTLTFGSFTRDMYQGWNLFGWPS